MCVLHKRYLFSMAASVIFGAGLLNAGAAYADIELDDIELPAGFNIEIFADDVRNARQMALGEQGTLFVGSRQAGRVHAVVDEDGDHRGDKVHVLVRRGKMPSAVAVHNGDLYVAEVHRILRFPNIESTLPDPPAPEIINDTYPTAMHHGWKFIGFGPDNMLYVPVGAPCNVCDESNDLYASITRLNPDGSGREIYAHGVRQSVGFDWHPVTKELWFTDNGRDFMGDEMPADELNRITEPGQHFGFPYIHAGDIPDPEYGEGHNPADYKAPAIKLGPHVAAIGMRFYTGDMFPPKYKNQIFIAEHGSWNRSEEAGHTGYRISVVTLKDNTEAVSYEPFATGWLQNNESWGRPADVLVMPDGSLLVSDDKADVIYRITYEN